MSHFDDPTLPASDGALLALGLQPVPEVDTIAPLFPELELIEQVGAGGMGVVYKARHRRLERLVALKLLHPKLAEEPAFNERFLREAQAMARLGHPGIVTIYDFGEREGLFFLAMAWIDGTNLRAVMQESLTPAQTVLLARQICDALAYAHDHGIVHRDIKPENILVDRQGHVFLADFGLAKLRCDAELPALTGSLHVIGTPRYMAPEQSERPREVDHRADIFALGVVFYEMLTGKVPVGHFPPPSKLSACDVRLDEVVLRAMARDPDERYQHASEVRTELETLEEREPVVARRLEARGSAHRRRGLWIALAVVVGFTSFMMLATFLHSSSDDSAEPVATASLAPTPSPSPEPEPEPEPLAERAPLPGAELLPTDTRYIVHVDTAAIRKTPLWDQLMAAVMQQFDGSASKQRCFALLYGIEWLTVAGQGSDEAYLTDALGRGRFTTADLHACLRSFTDDASLVKLVSEDSLELNDELHPIVRRRDLFAMTDRPQTDQAWLAGLLEQTQGLSPEHQAFVTAHHHPNALISSFFWDQDTTPGEHEPKRGYLNVIYDDATLVLFGEFTYESEDEAADALVFFRAGTSYAFGPFVQGVERDGATVRAHIPIPREMLDLYTSGAKWTMTLSKGEEPGDIDSRIKMLFMLGGETDGEDTP